MSQDDRSGLREIFDSCWAQYMEYLAGIASDIYDSCIQDYYDKYSPKIYDRHGYPDGANLYRANNVTFDDDDIDVSFDADRLWEYRGKEKRERILRTVMDGIRGAGSRRKSWRGWPKNWRTSYPNRYSNPEYSAMWSSSYTIINDIFQEFMSTAITRTSDYFNDLFFNAI